MKDTFYFQHDYNSRSDPKILMLRGKFYHEGYSVFWMLLESMAESSSGYLSREILPGLAIGYGSAIAQLLAIVEYCIGIGLLFENENGIFSKRMMEHKKYREERSASGKRGAVTRWEDSSAIAQPIAQPMQRKGKERKGNILPKGNTQKRELSKDKIDNHPLRPLVVHLQEILGTKIVNWPKQLKATKMIKDAGYEDWEIKGVIKWMHLKDEFFKDKGFDMMTVANNIDRIMVQLAPELEQLKADKRREYVSPLDTV